MAHKFPSVEKIADLVNTLTTTRQRRQDYAHSLLSLQQKAQTLQGEEINITGRLQTIGSSFFPADNPHSFVEHVPVVVKFAEIIDWDEYDDGELPYLYIVAWSPAHDQVITAVVNKEGVAIEAPA